MSVDRRPGSARARRTRPSPLRRAALLWATLLLCGCAEAAAQGQPAPTPAQKREDAAPPPMRYLPEETRTRLAAARDLKARTRLSLELAEARLVSADAHLAADRFDAATLDLGVYEAIVKDGLDFLRKTANTSKGKHRDHFKRLELGLREHVTRLETLRRGMPSQHAVHVQSTLDFVRDARAAALEAFFDDSIIPERPSPKPAPSPAHSAGGSAVAPSQKPERR